MDEQRPIYDVFVSHNQRDAEVAETIARAMQACGLKAFTGADVAEGDPLEDVIWEALTESQAFVAVIPDGEQDALPILELGAARAWNKPVYAVAARPDAIGLPVVLRGAEVFPLSRIEEVARQIRQSREAMSDDEVSALIEEYHRIGVSVDQLVLQPKLVTRLTRQFQKETGRKVASEELLRMLLRLRKQGKLQPAKRRKTPKSA